jgi:hypothetical protein
MLYLASLVAFSAGLASFYRSTMIRVQAKLVVSSLVTLAPDYPQEDRPNNSSNSSRVDLKLLLKLVGYVSVAATPLSLDCLSTLLQLGSWKDVLAVLAPLFTLFPLKDPLDSASNHMAANPFCLVQTAHRFVICFILVNRALSVFFIYYFVTLAHNNVELNK